VIPKIRENFYENSDLSQNGKITSKIIVTSKLWNLALFTTKKVKNMEIAVEIYKTGDTLYR
jgi:hypothetical protein